MLEPYETLGSGDGTEATGGCNAPGGQTAVPLSLQQRNESTGTRDSAPDDAAPASVHEAHTPASLYSMWVSQPTGVLIAARAEYAAKLPDDLADIIDMLDAELAHRATPAAHAFREAIGDKYDTAAADYQAARAAAWRHNPADDQITKHGRRSHR